MQPPVSIYLVDDQAMIRAAFRGWINLAEGFQVIGEAGDPRDAIAAIGQLRPDIVLLDIAMHGMSGIDALPLIQKAHPGVAVIMLTNQEGDEFVRQALDGGARGYLSKDSDPDELVTAITTVLSGQRYVSPKAGKA